MPTMKAPNAFDKPTSSITHAAAKMVAITIRVNVSMPYLWAAKVRIFGSAYRLNK